MKSAKPTRAIINSVNQLHHAQRPIEEAQQQGPEELKRKQRSKPSKTGLACYLPLFGVRLVIGQAKINRDRLESIDDRQQSRKQTDEGRDRGSHAPGAPERKRGMGRRVGSRHEPAAPGGSATAHGIGSPGGFHEHFGRDSHSSVAGPLDISRGRRFPAGR